MRKLKLSQIMKLPTKTTRPILTCAKSDGEFLYSTDLETMIKYKPDVNINFHGLYDLDKIDFLIPSEADVNEYPTFHGIPEENIFTTIDYNDLKELSITMSKEETRLYLCGIYFDFQAGVAVSTDGYKFTKIKLQHSDENLSGIIAPRNTILKVLSVMDKKQPIGITFNDDYIMFSQSGLEISGRLITREYPKYQAIIPTETKYNFTLTKNWDYKSLKPLLNKSQTVRIVFNVETKEVTLVVNDMISPAVVGVIPENLTENTTMFLNLKFLDELVTKKQMKFGFNDVLAPIVLENKILMPVRG